MNPGKALSVELRGPIISVRDPEVYQVAIAPPLPMPSTIVGAIGYAYWKIGLCSGEERCMSRAGETILKARASSAFSIKFSAVLSRYRGVLEEKRLPKDPNEISKFRDALVREYVFLDRFKVFILPSDDKYIGDIRRALLNVERIGDSESLVSISSIEEHEIEDCEGNTVNVVVRSSIASGGNYMIVRGLLENGEKSMLALPLMSERNYYRPSEIRLEASRRVKCAGNFRFPDGDNW
ncbi:MAG: type I-A CRISPR-associated protein Cas5a [Sulfolobales archaeon]